MTPNIGRRELIAALGGAVAMWPLAARAQRPERVYRVGYLEGSSKIRRFFAPRRVPARTP